MSDTPALPAYNGWPNQPTWLVHLWLTNDEGTQRAAEALVAAAGAHDWAAADWGASGSRP